MGRRGRTSSPSRRPPPKTWRPSCGASCASWERSSRTGWWTGPRTDSSRCGRRAFSKGCLSRRPHRGDPRVGWRCWRGFSLHADTHVHAHDRKGPERLCRYGSRPPLSLERLSLREDGTYGYRTRRGRVLVFTAAQLVKRLLALIPPKGLHLTRYDGLFRSPREAAAPGRPAGGGAGSGPPATRRSRVSMISRTRSSAFQRSCRSPSIRRTC
jgi:hypothetical protein